MDGIYIKNKAVFNSFQVIISLVPVLLGALIYVMWRPVQPLFIQWLTIIGFESGTDWLHDNYSSHAEYIPEWIIYSLPAGLWAFSYSFILVRIWIGSTSKIKFFWWSTIPLFIIGLELLQLTNLVRGTFSVPDLIVSALGILFGIFTALKINKIEKNEK